MLPQPDMCYISEKLAVLKSDYSFLIHVANHYYSVDIKAPYQFDGCTSGGWVTRLLVGLNRFGEHNFASLKHDFGYEKKGKIVIAGEEVYIPRKVWDEVFIEDLKSIRFKGTRLQLINIIVRFAGFFYWITPLNFKFKKR